MQLNEQHGSILGKRVRGLFPFLFLALLLVSVDVLAPHPAAAQRQPGSTGAGFQVGQPGGLALKLYQNDSIAYDGVISTDGDDFLIGHFHRLWEQPLPDSPLHFYLGPGMVVGLETLTQSPQLRLGLSTEAGLNFYAERFEVFLHVTPTLQFLPNTRVGLDGNVGLRYYLRFP